MTERTRDRYAMASVDDVVAIGSLDHRDRGQGATVAVDARDALPARGDAVRGRAEVGVEVGRGVDGPDDLLERDRPQSSRTPEQRGDVVEAPRPARPPSVTGDPAPRTDGEVAPTRAPEVGVRVDRGEGAHGLSRRA